MTDSTVIPGGYTSQSIAHNVRSQANDFTGTYDGGGYTITIGNVIPTYTGLFDSIVGNVNKTTGIIQNVNIIYKNTISITVGIQGLPVQSWGGIAGLLTLGTITNCSVTTNAPISITSGQTDTSHAIFCGYMGTNSAITNSQLNINNAITMSGLDNNSIGLFCGSITDSAVTNCSITTSGSYDISLTVTDNTAAGNYSSIGLISGFCGKALLALNPALLTNVTANLNNTGSISMNRIGSGTVYKGAICGSLDGDTDPTTIETTNCVININNNQILTGDQTLTGGFDDFFGYTTPAPETPTIQNCQFRYTTTTNNTSRPLTITNPASLPVASIVYVNNSNTYSLDSGSYYIPNTTASLSIGSQSIALQSQSPTGLVINGTLYSVGTSFSSSTPEYQYIISVNGVGSMYFGLDLTAIIPASVNSSIECICQIDSCATNPQTGISADSRITNTKQDKTIRVNVDREFAVNSIIAPKFNSYSDYMKYLQGALRR